MPEALVFDLVDRSRALLTSDASDAVARLMTIAARKSATVVMRITHGLELSSHDIWTIQEPNTAIRGSVVDAWGIFLRRTLPDSTKIAPSDLFARCHTEAIKPLRFGGTKALRQRNAAIKGHLHGYAV